jgi:hypothetical protein
VGGGIIFTVSVSIVNNAFEPDEPAKALGMIAGFGQGFAYNISNTAGMESIDVRGLVSGSASAEEHVKSLPGGARSLVEEITDIAFTHALRYVMLLGVILSMLCIWPALWGRRKPVPARAHPTSAHPLWASLWRRHHPRVPAGSTPAR